MDSSCVERGVYENFAPFVLCGDGNGNSARLCGLQCCRAGSDDDRTNGCIPNNDGTGGIDRNNLCRPNNCVGHCAAADRFDHRSNNLGNNHNCDNNLRNHDRSDYRSNDHNDRSL